MRCAHVLIVFEGDGNPSVAFGDSSLCTREPRVRPAGRVKCRCTHVLIVRRRNGNPSVAFGDSSPCTGEPTVGDSFHPGKNKARPYTKGASIINPRFHP